MVAGESKTPSVILKPEYSYPSKDCRQTLFSWMKSIYLKSLKPSRSRISKEHEQEAQEQSESFSYLLLKKYGNQDDDACIIGDVCILGK